MADSSDSGMIGGWTLEFRRKGQSGLAQKWDRRPTTIYQSPAAWGMPSVQDLEGALQSVATGGNDAVATASYTHEDDRHGNRMSLHEAAEKMHSQITRAFDGGDQACVTRFATPTLLPGQSEIEFTWKRGPVPDLDASLGGLSSGHNHIPMPGADPAASYTAGPATISHEFDPFTYPTADHTLQDFAGPQPFGWPPMDQYMHNQFTAQQWPQATIGSQEIYQPTHVSTASQFTQDLPPHPPEYDLFQPASNQAAIGTYSAPHESSGQGVHRQPLQLTRRDDRSLDPDASQRSRKVDPSPNSAHQSQSALSPGTMQPCGTVDTFIEYEVEPGSWAKADSCFAPSRGGRYSQGWIPKAYILEDGHTYVGPDPQPAIWEGVVKNRLKNAHTPGLARFDTAGFVKNGLTLAGTSKRIRENLEPGSQAQLDQFGDQREMHVRSESLKDGSITFRVRLERSRHPATSSSTSKEGGTGGRKRLASEI